MTKEKEEGRVNRRPEMTGQRESKNRVSSSIPMNVAV
jgi:hypothetical protein